MSSLKLFFTRAPLPAVLVLPLAFTFSTASAQNRPVLEQLSRKYRQELDARRGADYLRLLQSADPAQRALNEDPSLALMFVRPGGMPAYYRLHNLNAAKSVRTWDVWPVGVGGGGYAATGATTAAGELAVWDGGGVRTTHQEFGGRVTQMDVAPLIQHATHVAGTMVAAGVSAGARGMSYAAPLHAYEWNNDTGEMAAAAAAGLQVSNHSYGFATGWEPSGGWTWFGDMSVNATEDYGFGFYGGNAREFDEIMYNAPHYLICMSAGNDRSDAGPAPGGVHTHWDGFSWVGGATDTHGTDYQNFGYDTISWTGNAKNVLLVGAVNDIPGGYTVPANVVQTAFSSWGPTDDGRIKPDIVANGANLTSTNNSGDVSYVVLSGTSMSSPSVAGSVNLAAQEYEIVRGTKPWGSTVKALAINAADEAGVSDGPDYQNGWGLLNTKRMLDIVHAASDADMGVVEATLENGTTDEYWFAVTTPADVRVTIVWTDPPAAVGAPMLDNPAQKLVNDLDMVMEDAVGGTTTRPWNLSVVLPGNAATKGPNHVDNVEQIDLAAAPASTYKVTVSHTGAITSGAQSYALVYRGMHPTGPLLPVLISRFEARAAGRAVDVRWELAGDETAERFTLLRRAGSEPVPAVAGEGIVTTVTGSFRDENVEPATTYYYELLVRTANGDEFRSPVASVTTPAGVLSLGQNRPNPFNPQTVIPYTLRNGSTPVRVRLLILDVAGKVVRTLVDKDQAGGAYEAVWDGRDNRGGPVPSGVYFYRLDADGERRTRKLVLLK